MGNYLDKDGLSTCLSHLKSYIGNKSGKLVSTINGEDTLGNKFCYGGEITIENPTANTMYICKYTSNIYGKTLSNFQVTETTGVDKYLDHIAGFWYNGKIWYFVGYYTCQSGPLQNYLLYDISTGKTTTVSSLVGCLPELIAFYKDCIFVQSVIGWRVYIDTNISTLHISSANIMICNTNNIMSQVSTWELVGNIDNISSADDAYNRLWDDDIVSKYL